MASKVNTRFILIVVAAVVVAGGILGGLWFLQWRGDATRNIRQGDAAMAAGDFKLATECYGRAVSKQPGNMDYLTKLEGAMVQRKPETTDQAMQLYRQRVELMRHRARHRSNDPQAHLTLLKEETAAAKLSGNATWWEMLASDVKDMLQSVPEDDAAYQQGRVYKSLATLNQASAKELSDLNDAIDELRDVIKRDPSNDMAWATLIDGLRVVADKMRVSGMQAGAISQKWTEIDQAAAEAIKAVPNGPRVARAALWRMVARLSGDPDSIAQDEIDKASDHLVATMKDQDDPVMVGEAADLLANSITYISKATEMLERLVAKHPDYIDKRLSLAWYEFMSSKIDEASQDANAVLNSDVLPVSLVGQGQFEYRKSAAALLVDVEQKRWEMATEQERPGRMKTLEAAREKLAAQVSNPSSDLQVLRADGRIAMAKGDYDKAVNCFERVIRESPSPSIEILVLASDGLSQIGQIGLAHERLSSAIEAQPRNWFLVEAKARMEVRMNRLDEAKATLSGLPPEELAKPEVKALVQGVNNAMTEVATSAPSDSTSEAVKAAIAELNKGEPATARTMLEAELAKSPGHLGVIVALVQVEFQDNHRDKAREYIKELLRLQPTNVMFKQWEVAIDHEDPIDALKVYQDSAIPDEGTRAVVMALSLSNMASQQEAAAQRLAKTDPAESDKAKDLASRARKEMDKYLALARDKAPTNRDLIEYEFNRALGEKNWSVAEQVITRAKAGNVDQVDGNFYKGRMELARGNIQEAIHTLEAVTDRLNYSSFAWRMLAVGYSTLGNWGQAQRAYEQAYACNPNDMYSAQGYIAVMLRRGDYTRALTVLRSTRKLAPRDIGMREAWLKLEAEYGDKAMAFAERRKIYDANPGDKENAKSYARMLCEIIPSPDYMLDLSGNPIISRARWSGLNADERQAVITATRAEWQRKADEIVDALSKSGEDDLALAVLKSRLFRIRSQITEGEQALRDFIESHKDKRSPAMLIELARYQEESNHPGEALKTLEEAATIQDPKTLEADVELGRMYLRLNAFERAVPALLKVEAINPTTELQQQIVECYLRMKNFDEAEKRLKAITGSDRPGITTMLKSSISEARANELLAKGDVVGAEQKFAEQRELLAKAESQDVNNPTPRVLLAQSNLLQYRRSGQKSRLEDAMLALERADKILPGDIQTSMLRVDVLKERGDHQAAIAELRRVLERQPDQPVARRQLLQMYLDTGDQASAFETVSQAVAENPTLGIWHETLGDLYHMLRRDPVNAYKCYLRAYELVPNPGMLSKMLDCALSIQPPDYRGAIDRVTKHAEDMTSMPTLRLLYARSLAGLDHRDEGLEQMRQAYADYRSRINLGTTPGEDINEWFSYLRYFFQSKDIAQLDAFVRELAKEPDSHELRILARMWAGTGMDGLNHAKQLQAQAIERCPAKRDELKGQLQLEMGNYELVDKQFAAARAQFEASLKSNPSNIDALNNLAFILVDSDPQAALPLAEKALALAPRDPAVLDTAGWVNFKAGNVEKAKDYLSKSLEIAEQSSSTHAHLAHVLSKSGDVSGAREHLKRAKELKPDPDTMRLIEELEKEIA